MTSKDPGEIVKILIVDDSELNLNMLDSLLRSGRYEVICAKNGEEALKKLESERVGLIISDTLMPVMDGFQLCNKVKIDDRFKEIPFIFYSGTCKEDEDIELARKLGAARYLIRPIEPSELLKEIQVVIKDTGKGECSNPRIHLPEEKEIYQLYNKRLISKLERMMSKLESAQAEREKMNCDLRKASEEWRGTFNSISDIVMVLDNDNKIRKANTAASKFLKMPVETIVGKACYQLVHSTNSPIDNCPLETIKQTKRHAEAEVYLPKKDLWVLASMDPLFDAEGRMIGGVHIIKDITERKRMEKELADAMDAQYSALVENLPGKVYFKDRNSVYISCNSNFARDLKIGRKEICKKTDFDLFPTYLAVKYRADDERIMKSGKTENVKEEYMVIKDFLRGSDKVYINTVKVPVRDNSGNIIGLFGLFWDITEQKKMQETLRSTERKMRAIFDQAFQYMGLVALDGTLLEANNTALQFAGIGESDCLGKPFWDTAWWTHSVKMQEKLREAVVKAAGGETVTFEATHIAVDGSTHYIDFSLKPIKDENGKIIFLVPEGRDITERKLLEDKIRRAEDLKAAVEIKSKFASMVSHEIRSPMAVIKESINLIIEGLAGNITLEQKDILNTAKSNIDRLSRLINNVLDFQKMEDGRAKLDIKENDFNRAVLATSREMNLLAEKKGLSFIVNLDEKIPKISFDRDKIAQVVTNLLSNAIKFTERGSVSVTTKSDNNVVHVIIQDTGLGLNSEEMPKLFHAFEQLGGGEGKKKGGTGLGLAISKEIIQAHKGKIWAESKFGIGSTFHFTLPIKERRN